MKEQSGNWKMLPGEQALKVPCSSPNSETNEDIPFPAQNYLSFLPATQPFLSGVQGSGAPIPLACLHPGAVSLPGTGWEQEGYPACARAHTSRPSAAGGLCL